MRAKHRVGVTLDVHLCSFRLIFFKLKLEEHLSSVLLQKRSNVGNRLENVILIHNRYV